MDFKLAKRYFEDCAYNISYDSIGHDVNYKFVEEGSHLYVYFQGSKDITADKGWIDWLRNFWFFPMRKKPYKGMTDKFYVHSGFLSAWKEMEDLFISKITEKNGLKWKYDKITIIGYSHGAALACLAHESAWFYRPDLNFDLETYAFEAPRAYGGFRTKKSLRERWKNCHVFRNGTDIVTHCPPRLFGFCHVGDLLSIDGDTSCVRNRLPKCIKCHFQKPIIDGLEKAAEKDGDGNGE